MTDLKPILNAVRLSFSQHEIFSWGTDYKKIVRDSGINFPVRIHYEVVGSFLSDNKIKVIASLKEFSISEQIFDEILRELKEAVINIIKERTPETNEKIEIIFQFKDKMVQLSN